MNKITMKDIAGAANVSVNAVSLALNDRKGVSEETRIRIMETAQKLGYLDRKLRYIKTFGQHHICVLILDIYEKELKNLDFYNQILYHVIREAKYCGYDIIVHYFNEQSMSIPDCITKRHVAGIIVLGKISTLNIQRLMAVNTRMVIADHNPRLPNINCIVTDNISGGYMAAQYLIGKGFAKIGYIGDFSYSKSVKERYYGFLEALVQEGLITFEETGEYIRKYSLMAEIEPFIMNNNIDAIKRILPPKARLPQAYFCNNDAAAIMVMEALKEKGIKIPEEISVIGFDNNDRAGNFSPALTTINVNRELMGQKAVRQLIRLIDNENSEAEHTVLGVELVERDSVRPAQGWPGGATQKLTGKAASCPTPRYSPGPDAKSPRP
ncbi:MAG: LacI family DNA-binding transcriptional regulator [Treponema sp.]|jgi:LacI family transcriptional regulator|nr:LacI family DNA-binding transcriptional regulator [Treponema sp.]